MRKASLFVASFGLMLFCAFSTTLLAQVTGGGSTGRLPPQPQAQPLAQPLTQPLTQPQAQTSALPDQGYILGSEDVLQIDVLGRSDFSIKGKVGTDGKIQLPLLGSVTASDKTVLQLGDEIRQALQKGGFFTKPIVVVQVVSYASRYVTVLGAVGAPGLIPVDGGHIACPKFWRVWGASGIAEPTMSLCAPKRANEVLR